MTRIVVAIGLVAVACVIVVVALRFRESDRERRAREDAFADAQAGSRKLVHMCDDAGARVEIGVAEGTSSFGAYFATDRAKARELLRGVVAAVVDANETACRGAQQVIAEVIAQRPDDRFVVAALPRVAAAQAYFTRVDAAMKALGDALDANAAADTLVERLGALRTATKAHLPAPPE